MTVFIDQPAWNRDAKAIDAAASGSLQCLQELDVFVVIKVHLTRFNKHAGVEGKFSAGCHLLWASGPLN